MPVRAVTRRWHQWTVLGRRKTAAISEEGEGTESEDPGWALSWRTRSACSPRPTPGKDRRPDGRPALVPCGWGRPGPRGPPRVAPLAPGSDVPRGSKKRRDSSVVGRVGQRGAHGPHGGASSPPLHSRGDSSSRGRPSGHVGPAGGQRLQAGMAPGVSD